MLGMSVGTTPLDLKAATTAADDCAEMPTGEHFEFLFSVLDEHGQVRPPMGDEAVHPARHVHRHEAAAHPPRNRAEFQKRCSTHTRLCRLRLILTTVVRILPVR